MQQNKTTDLGKDRIGRLLFRLAVPAITAQLINALYNIVDRMYIGHIEGVGAAALTGVGVTFPIIMLISAFSALVGMGGAPRASIKMGAKNNDEAEEIMGNCFVALIAISVVLTAFFLVFQRDLLMMFGASEDTIGYALDYLNIYVCGTIFVQMSLGLNAFITSQGFATTSMITVLIGAILNIVLDPLFIFGLGMGVKGAALATIISQAVSCFWVIWFLCGKKTILRLRKKYLKLKANVILPVLALGLAPFVMQSTESLVNISLNSSLQRFGGDQAVGAMTILSSVMQVVTMPMTGLTQGSQPIIGYNFGAGNVDRVKKTFRLLLTSCLILSVTSFTILMLVPQAFASVFTSDPALLDKTVWAMRIFMAGTFALGAQFSCQQTFIAVGQAKVSLFLALLRKVILLIPLVFILPCFLADKVFAVFLAEPIADILASSTTTTVFFLRIKGILARGVAGKKTQSLEP